MVWDGSTGRVYGEHQFTHPIERSISPAVTTVQCYILSVL